jgi:hypothetical protein
MPHKTIHIPGDGEIEDRRNHEISEWARWIIGGLLGAALMMGSGALGWLMNHEHRMTRVEDGQINGTVADRQMREDFDQARKEAREDVKEMKADIKELLQRTRR